VQYLTLDVQMLFLITLNSLINSIGQSICTHVYLLLIFLVCLLRCIYPFRRIQCLKQQQTKYWCHQHTRILGPVFRIPYYYIVVCSTRLAFLRVFIKQQEHTIRRKWKKPSQRYAWSLIEDLKCRCSTLFVYLEFSVSTLRNMNKYKQLE